MQREHAGRASWECQEELFRQEVENADDIRLSHRLMRKCMGDKKKFCNDVPAGEFLLGSQLDTNSDQNNAFLPKACAGFIQFPLQQGYGKNT